MHQANIVTQSAIRYITQQEYLRDENKTWTPSRMKRNIKHHDYDITHFCAPVIHPTTGKIFTQYRELSRDPTLSEV